jgi:hypothetical protein
MGRARYDCATGVILDLADFPSGVQIWRGRHGMFVMRNSRKRKNSGNLHFVYDMHAHKCICSHKRAKFEIRKRRAFDRTERPNSVSSSTLSSHSAIRQQQQQQQPSNQWSVVRASWKEKQRTRPDNSGGIRDDATRCLPATKYRFDLFRGMHEIPVTTRL